VVGMSAITALALFQGLPFLQENISPSCTEPIQKNVNFDNNFIDCNKFPLQLSHDLGLSLSGSITSSGARVTSNPLIIK